MSSAVIDTGVCARVRHAVAELRRAEHRLLGAVAELAGSDVAAVSGYRSPGRLLQDLARVDPAHATRLLTHAGALTAPTGLSGPPREPDLPATAAAHADGTLGEEHVRVITRAVDALRRVPDLAPATVTAAEATLAAAAVTLAPHGVDRVAARLRAHLDPDGVAPLDPPEPDDELLLRRRRDGAATLTGTVHGAADVEQLFEVLDAFSIPTGPDDTRGLPARRAEALLDLVALAAELTDRHHATDDDEAPSDGGPIDAADDDTAGDAAGDEAGDEAGAGAGADDPEADNDPAVSNEAAAGDTAGDSDHRAAPPAVGGESPAPGTGPPPRTRPRRPLPVLGRALITVTIDHHRLQLGVGHGLLDSEHPLSAADTRRLACDAALVPTVLGARSEPLDVARLTYTVPDPLRRALHTRDRGCTFPGCHRPPRRTHAHHIQHWADGGPTALHNLTLLCRYHHHLIHHDHWHIHQHQGRPWYTPPPWIDPTRQPRPGGPHPPELG